MYIQIMAFTLRIVLFAALVSGPMLGCGDDSSSNGSSSASSSSLGLGTFNEEMRAVEVPWSCENGTYTGVGRVGPFGTAFPSEAAVFLWDLTTNTLSEEKARFTVTDSETNEATFPLEGFTCGELTHAVVTVSFSEGSFGEPAVYTALGDEDLDSGGGYIFDSSRGQAQIGAVLSREVSGVTLLSMSLITGMGKSLEFTANGQNDRGDFSYTGTESFSPDIGAFAKIRVIRDGANVIKLSVL